MRRLLRASGGRRGRDRRLQGHLRSIHAAATDSFTSHVRWPWRSCSPAASGTHFGSSTGCDDSSMARVLAVVEDVLTVCLQDIVRSIHPAAFRTSSVLSTRLRQPVHLARSATIDYCPPSASVTSPGSSTPLPPPFTSRLRWPSKFAPSLPLGRPRDRPRCCDASFTSRLRGRRGVLIVRLQESPWAIHPSATPRSRSRVRSPSPGTTPSPPFDPRGVLREHREARDPESKTEGKIKGGSHVWGK
jgi:hypothetical protein